MQKIQFSDMELSNEMQRAVEEMGFEEPTSIQAASIPMILSGRDVIGHSQTGTGKTAAFSIPAIEKINPAGGRKTQVLILCPTRELAVQACDEIRKFAKYKPFLKVVPIYGGQPIERQFTALRGGAQIVVGTPGRVMDHMRRGTLKLDTLHMIILDEADEMLSMGFREDIETILKDVPQERQTILFSATMSPEIMRITKQYQTDPELIRITREQLTVPNIEQTYYEVPVGKKTEVLSRLLDVYNPSRSIVFCNTKKQVDELVEELHARGSPAVSLSDVLSNVFSSILSSVFSVSLLSSLSVSRIISLLDWIVPCFSSSSSILSINSGFLNAETPFNFLAFARSFKVASDKDSYFSLIIFIILCYQYFFFLKKYIS